MFSEFEIGIHSLFTFEDKAEMMNQKLDNIVIVARLLGYSTCIIYDEVEPEIQLQVRKSESVVLFTMHFKIKPYTNRLQHLSMTYVKSDGLLGEVNTYRRSVKYILNKAQYLLK